MQVCVIDQLNGQNVHDTKLFLSWVLYPERYRVRERELARIGGYRFEAHQVSESGQCFVYIFVR